MIELKLPELGENIQEAEVIRLLVSEGDTIKADQNVMDLESEKAAFPLPSTRAGKVTKIHVKEGQAVSIGQTLLEIEEATEAPPEQNGRRPGKTENEQTAREEVPEEEKLRHKTEPGEKEAKPVVEAEAPKKGPPPDRHAKERERKGPAPAGPATRRLARELGIDLSEVKGSEPGGRISRDDVKAHVRGREGAVSRDQEVPPLPDFGRWGAVKRQQLNRIARTGAERLSLAWRIIPHVTQHELADITELEEARRRYNQDLAEGKPKITVTVLAIQAAVAALKAYPQFNSSFDPANGELIVKEYYHIGVAVDTEHGLLVPVLRDADRKTVVELARELAELAEKARNRSLARENMEGGTFTITNLGGIGGTAFTPIINYPEVAILGISRARWERVPRDGKFVRRLLLPLSLSYDHRVINGADGARFVGKVAGLLSGAFKLLAES